MKTKLYLAILSATACSFSAYSANIYDNHESKLDIFGDITAMVCNDRAARALTSVKEKGNHDNTLHTAVNFGISGKTIINENADAVAFSEWMMPTDSNGFDEFKTKGQYVGIDGHQYGILTLGRGDNAFYTITGVTDVYNQLNTYAHDHYVWGDYQQGLFMYALSAMGFDLRISYQTAVDDVSDSNVDLKNGAAIALATTTSSGIGIAYGISYYDLKKKDVTDGSAFYTDNLIKMYHRSDKDYAFANALQPSFKIDRGFSITYGNFGDGLYLALNGTQTKYDNFTNNLYALETIANYHFENGFSATIGYSLKRFADTNLLSDLTFGTYYQVMPTFNVFLEGAVDLGGHAKKFYSIKQIENMSYNENKVIVGAQYLY